MRLTINSCFVEYTMPPSWIFQAIYSKKDHWIEGHIQQKKLASPPSYESRNLQLSLFFYTSLWFYLRIYIGQGKLFKKMQCKVCYILFRAYLGWPIETQHYQWLKNYLNLFVSEYLKLVLVCRQPTLEWIKAT